MKRRDIIISAFGVLLLAVLLFMAFVLPMIVRSQLEERVARATDRICTIADVAINPLTLSAEVRGAKLREKGSQAVFASFSSLDVRMSPSSLWRLAPVVRAANLHSPYLHLVRTGTNAYNFSDLVNKPPKGKESSAAPRFSLNNIVVANGHIDFDDLAIAQPKQHRVEQLRIQVPFISSIPYLADRYVEPRITATVNGAQVQFRGKLKPFKKGFLSVVNFDLKELDLPYYTGYLPKKPPLRVTGGRLSVGLEVSHRLAPGDRPDVTVTGTLSAEGLVLAERSGTPLLTANRMEAKIRQGALLTHSLDIAELSVDRPELTLSRDRQGGWNYQRIFGKGRTRGADEEPREKPGGKVSVSFEALRVHDGTIRFRDDAPAGGFTKELRQVNLEMTRFVAGGGKPADFRLSFLTARQERAEAAGRMGAGPFMLSSRLTVAGLAVEDYYPYVAPTLRERVRGRLDGTAEVAYDDHSGLSLSRASLRLRNAGVRFGAGDGVRLPLVTVEGGVLRLKERQLKVGRLAVSGGRIDLSRDEQGTLSSQLLLQPGSSPPARGKSAAPFRWQVDNLAVNRLAAAFTDRTREDNPRFGLNRISLTAKDLTGPKTSRIPFTIAAGYGKEGSLAAQGRVLPRPFQLQADCTLQRIPILDAEPYLPEGINVVLADGRLAARLKLDLAQQSGGLAGSFRGGVGIRDFYSLSEDGNEDLFRWESLQVESITGTLQPFTLAMTGATLQDYYARIIINKRGRFNLQDLYTPPARPVAGPSTAQPAATRTAPAATADRRIRIDTVTLQNGVLDFTDHHLNREFSTKMLNVGGRISGLTSEPGQAADVDLRGNLENRSPLRIAGKINPLQEDLFLDLFLNFSDIELSPLSPYSGTYLGYIIDEGKLSVALRYRIEQKKLTAENKVFLDQFTFGQQVESSKATSLPVRLAVALLKDRKGEIHLELPLSGRTDEPNFSIWRVVGKMLKNLLVKASTSPFALLRSAFGGKEDFSNVVFAPGMSRLSTGEEAKLRTLAKVLHDRPALKLEVTGFVDRKRDAEGYRDELLLKKMKAEKFLALAKEKRLPPGLTPERVELPPSEQSLWLKTVYEKEKFPRPRTFIGTLKSLPDAEMRKLILVHMAVGDEQLRALARGRAVTVVNFLVRDGNLTQDRIFEKGGNIFAPPREEGINPCRVEFGVVAH